MRSKKLHWIMQKCIALFSLMLLAFPLSAIGGSLACKESAFFTLLFPVIAYFLGAVNFVLPGKLRKWYVVLSLILYGAASYFVIPSGVKAYVFLGALPGAGMLVLAPVACGQESYEEWHAFIWAGGLLSGLVVQLVYELVSRFQTPQFSQLGQILVWLDVAAFFMFLVNSNRRSIQSGLKAKEGTEAAVPQNMKNRSNCAIVILFLVSLIGANWKGIEKGADFVLNKIAMGIHWLLIKLRVSKTQIGRNVIEEGEKEIEGAGELTLTANRSPAAEFFSKVLIWIAAVGAVIMVIFITVFLIRKLIVLIKFLWKKFQTYGNQSTEDYIDEAENIFDSDKLKKQFQKKWKERFERKTTEKEPDWTQLDGRSKVRFLYRKYWKSHPDLQHLTAREAIHEDRTFSRQLSDDFSSIYEEARYSDHDILDEKAEKMRERLKF